MQSVFFEFKRFLNENSVLRNSKVLIALSGGPDSVSLLHLSKLFFGNIIAAHVNHNLRINESEEEEIFCKELCKSLNIPLFVKKLNDEEKLNGNQKKYRDLRYKFLSSVFKDNNCDYLLVGHHKNDQSETVFYNILKGSGVDGLIGIKPLSYNYEMQIVRPLLKLTKSELLDYLHSNNLEYKTDSSNLKNEYTRNKIRNNIIPELESELDVNLTESLSNLSENMADIYDMFSYYNQKIDQESLVIKDDAFMIDLPNIRKFHKAIIKNYFLYFSKKYLGIRNISKSNILDLYNLMDSQNKSIINFPNNFICEKQKKYLKIYSNLNKVKSFVNQFKEIVPVDSQYHYVHEINKLIKFEYVDRVSINDTFLYMSSKEKNLVISSYEEGSKILYTNTQHKKIKKLIKEKSQLSLNEIWYIQQRDKVIYIPQINFKNFKSSHKDKYILKITIKDVTS